jgi:hypothetical protein
MTGKFAGAVCAEQVEDIRKMNAMAAAHWMKCEQLRR